MEEFINQLNGILDFKYTTAIMAVWFVLVLILGYLWGFKRGLIANIINVVIIFAALVVAAIISVSLRSTIGNALSSADDTGMLKDSGLLDNIVGYLALFIHLITLIIFMIISGIIGMFRKKPKRTFMRPFYGLISMAGSLPIAAFSTAIVTPITKHDNGMSKFVSALSIGFSFTTANGAEGIIESLAKTTESINKINSDNPEERKEGAHNILNDPAIGNLLDKLITQNNKKEENKPIQPVQPDTSDESSTETTNPNQPADQPAEKPSEGESINKIFEELIGDNESLIQNLKNNKEVIEGLNKITEINTNEITTEQINEFTAEFIKGARENLGNSKQLDALLSVIEEEGLSSLSNNGVKIVELGVSLVKSQLGNESNIKFDEINDKLKDIINKAVELKNLGN
ncbi:hypothetical protein [Mycoplasma anserisalpingitidis]|uniref:hypothetical protein n=1 Tax=Mycoplasma anserisalpingitidis TaxID=519450 RepID=UPI001CF6B41D|nr:hypothetical protein [Mycoplasma anserisalpingitidis]UCU26335.1 hypothetical protein K7D06_01820 [Mycoplasma anserisalpingitidis]UCU27174.1 hypothetical protein K9O38_02490 [Mycoplasma anserisalpingitidis]